MSRYASGHHGWYRAELVLDEHPSVPLGIMLRRVNMNAAIYLNGEYIASGGQLTEPISRNWNYPLYTSPPRSLWRLGTNIIHVRHASYPGGGYMPPIFVGRADLLEPEYETLMLLQVRTAEFLFPVTLFMAVLVMFTWARRRQEYAYLWFALAIAAWSVYILNMFVKNPWLSNHAWEWVAHYAVDLWVILFCFFARAFVGVRSRTMNVIYITYLTTLAIAYAIVDTPTLDSLIKITHALSMAFGFHLGITMFASYTKSRERTPLFLGLGIMAMLLTGIHDWIFVSGWSGETGTFRLLLHYYCAPLVFAALAWHLTSRFAVALQESESLNRNLEDRVHAAEADIKAHFARVTELERERAVLQEQERLSKDIHDSIGGSLANAIMLTELVERNRDLSRLTQLKGLLTNGLTEVRHVISAMAGDIANTASLADYLTDKSRTSAEGLGIDFICENEVQPAMQFDSHVGLSLARIATEAINNALKHGQCSRITLRLTEIDTHRLRLEVEDDGIGIDPHPKQGYGLENMARRCASIGASLDIHSLEDGGTAVVVCMEFDA